MEQSTQLQDSEQNELAPVRESASPVEFGFAALALALFVLWIYAFHNWGTLGEDDLYRVLDGLLDGALTGQGIASPLHYGKVFSFGYIAAFYALAAQSTLTHAQPLITLINSVGFWATVLGSIFFWLAVRVLYGVRAATIAFLLFAFSPMMLDVGTSGHQILVAFAFFSAAAVLLFLPVNGWLALACQTLAALLLLAALVSRAEILLAWPFLVLARVDLRSIGAFLLSALRRSMAPVLSLAAFFVSRALYLSHGRGALGPQGSFSDIGFSLATVPRGLVSYLIGCGILTAIAGLVAAARLIRTAAAVAPNSEIRLARLSDVIGPLSLVLPAMVFWMTNGLPPRHFILSFIGLAMLIGLALTRFATVRTSYFLAVGIVLANQAAGTLTGPFILKHYPTKILTVPGQQPLMPRVPLGSSLGFHESAQAARLRTDAFAERLLGACDAKTIVFSEREPQIVAHLYEGNRPWRVEEQLWRRFPLFIAQDRNVSFMVVSPHEGWPQDVVGEMLADPAFNEYKLVRDPDTISIYDKTPIPENRAARFGCVSLLAEFQAR